MDFHKLPAEVKEPATVRERNIWNALCDRERKEIVKGRWNHYMNATPHLSRTRTLLKRFLCGCGEVRRPDGTCCSRPTYWKDEV